MIVLLRIRQGRQSVKAKNNMFFVLFIINFLFSLVHFFFLLLLLPFPISLLSLSFQILGFPRIAIIGFMAKMITNTAFRLVKEFAVFGFMIMQAAMAATRATIYSA
jgi:hypothetical protein